MPAHFFRSARLPIVGRAVAVIDHQKRPLDSHVRTDDLEANCFFARLDQISQVERKLEHPLGANHYGNETVIEGFLDEVENAMESVLVEKVPKEMLGACLPVRLEKCDSEDLEAVVICNEQAHEHMTRVEDRHRKAEVAYGPSVTT
jgi:hypothetical protein